MDARIKLGTMGSRRKRLRDVTKGGIAYIGEEKLNILAKNHPQDYLRILDTVVHLVANPPSFAGFRNNKTIILGQFLFQDEDTILETKAKFIKTSDGWELVEVIERSSHL
mgnify:CR=1 FL=1